MEYQLNFDVAYVFIIILQKGGFINLGNLRGMRVERGA
jgi:hypothetical protein